MKRSLLLTLSLATLSIPAAAQIGDRAPRLIPRKPSTLVGAATATVAGQAPAAPSPAPIPPTTPTPATPGAPAASPGTAGPAGSVLPNGKVAGDTTGLAQFEQGVQYEPRSPNYLVSFSLEDADLSELVRVIAQLTGKRFIFGGKLKTIKATVYSPQKVTVAEAYQAFLPILETNGLTVIPHGRFFKIIETQGSAAQGTPIYNSSQAATGEDRYITRVHRLAHVSADEAANVLGKFKSKDADITVHAPGNLLIITDTGTNIRRMMHLLEEIDVGGAGEQVFIEPINYAAAADIAHRVNELFDVKGGTGAGNTPAPGKGAPAGAGAGPGADRIAKIVADDRTNTVVIVATEKAYLRILELVKRLDVPQSGEGEIHVLPLQHADSVELAKTLGDIISGAKATGDGRRGAAGAGGAAPPTGVFEGGIKVSADKATNSLVITSSLRDYASLRAVIDRLDQPRRQVFIEAVIMDLQLKRSDAFGVSFHGGSDFSTGAGDGLVYGGNKILNTITPIPTDPDALQGFALGVRGPGISGTSSLLGTGISVPAFGSFIQALARTGDSDLLSTPHILALDNEKAEISVGDNIPLQTNAVSAFPGVGGAAGGALGALGGLGGLGSVGSPRQDVGTKITITPHLNESNDVRLDVIEDISEQGAPLGGTLGAIPISKRTANTKLVVRDQQTVVIGGLLRSVVSRAEEKIPVLGDIPVLGALFRKRQNTLEKRNLVLILTPYIIRSQDDLRTVFERKMQERQEFLDRYFVFSDNEYTPPRDYSRLNGLVEDIRQAYFQVEEKRRLDEITRPKELKGHEPQRPLEMPGGVRGAAQAGGTAAAPDQPAAPAPQAPTFAAPRVRNFEKIER